MAGRSRREAIKERRLINLLLASELEFGALMPDFISYTVQNEVRAELLRKARQSRAYPTRQECIDAIYLTNKEKS